MRKRPPEALAVNAGGIEHKPAIVGAAVFERIAGRNFVRQFLDKLRDQFLKFVRVDALRGPAAFQGTGDRREIERGLGSGNFFGELLNVAQAGPV